MSTSPDDPFDGIDMDSLAGLDDIDIDALEAEIKSDGATGQAELLGAASEPATGPGPSPVPPASSGKKPVQVALILTPVAGADLLAAMCKLSGIDAQCIPTPAGAVANLADAGEQAANASCVSLSHVMVRVAPIMLVRRGPSEDPSAGDVQASRWFDGAKVADLPPGLIVTTLPSEIENLILDWGDQPSVDGTVDSARLSRLAAGRIIAKSALQARRGKKDGEDE